MSTTVSADRRAGVTSALFAVLYIGISVLVVGIGIAAQSAGLKTASVGAALAVAALQLLAAISLIVHPVGAAER